MKIDDELFGTILIAWVVLVTVLLGILLPYTVNVPTMPAFFYRTVTERASMPSVPDFIVNQSGAGNTNRLLVYYDFEDEAFAKNHFFSDQSGNANNAIANGVFISTAPGIIENRSVVLPGTGYLYSYPDPAAGKSDVTFSLWFTVPDQAHNYRLASAISASGPRSGWILGTRSSDLWDSQGNPIRILTGSRSAGALPFSAWNHKALVYNGSRVTEYLNGVVVSGYPGSGRPLGTGKAMLIGSWEPFGQNYAGRIDDFRIYDYSLNESQVAGLYREGVRTGT